MKKKLLITILAIIALVSITTFTILYPMEDTVTHFQYTGEIHVEEGVIEEKETIIPFDIEEDGKYVIYANWKAEKSGMISGLAVKNEEDEIVSLVTGESVEFESNELELDAGKYKAEYTYFFNEKDLEQYLEDADVKNTSEDYVYASNEDYEIVYDFELVQADSIEYKLGFLMGILITLIGSTILSVFLLKSTKKDGKIKCKYDERQLQAQGAAFKYGFFTMIIYNGFFAVFNMAGIYIPVADGALLVFGMLLGVFVYAVYCIQKEAYISLNENATRLTILFILIGLTNLLIGVRNLTFGKIIVDGILTISCLNLVCGVMILVVAIVMNFHRNKSEDDEEE